MTLKSASAISLLFCLASLVSACQTKGNREASDRAETRCELLEPITDPSNAAYARVRCGKTAPIEALCDFTLDPAEFGGSGFIQPTELHWAKHGPNEGVAYHWARGSGFIVCQKD